MLNFSYKNSKRHFSFQNTFGAASYNQLSTTSLPNYIANKITNLEFGGKNKQNIVVTTANGLFLLESNLAGL
ncbi:hypothetical protein DS2_10798 [Catenovulum agarivorans DS-2]|uniref:Uncharacterized protein n=1 Tax=Catenovulum agarivorans DS-2 TaxID=1328313 RepID=W7QAD7_9ALTE|nr:hypothetical protein DS2_10798 [Catenovulum agarivorans DS-2]